VSHDTGPPEDAIGVRRCAGAGRVPVWVAASLDGDVVLVPAGQLDEAAELLRRASHQVTG